MSLHEYRWLWLAPLCWRCQILFQVCREHRVCGPTYYHLFSLKLLQIQYKICTVHCKLSDINIIIMVCFHEYKTVNFYIYLYSNITCNVFPKNIPCKNNRFDFGRWDATVSFWPPGIWSTSQYPVYYITVSCVPHHNILCTTSPYTHHPFWDRDNIWHDLRSPY